MTLYGNTLAWESSPAQTMRHQPMRLLAQPSYTGAYDIDQDPLWTHTPQALPIDVLAWYQCDHLGTPQELTDPTGQIAWSAQYKAWGEVTEQRSDWALQKGLANPIRFQGNTTITKRGCTTIGIGTMIHGSAGLSAKTRSAMRAG